MAYRIAILPGDGIGVEVMQEALKVLRAVTDERLRCALTEAEVGAGLYQRTGDDLPREVLDLCATADAILFGAAGLPDVRARDGTEIAPQLRLRFGLELYAGVRPIRLYPGVPSPLRLPADRTIDYVIFRENTEGLFASRGGAAVGSEVATDTLVITRRGTERVARRAFEMAMRRRRRVTCVDKSNVFRSYLFFRQVVQDVARAFPDAALDVAYIDAMAMYLVQKPWAYDVVVVENQFGDIISDLGAATVGGLGIAPSGDVGDHAALFQPSHGTAPDIAGKGIANPIAMILSAAMMLRWLGDRHRDPAATAAGDRIEAAVSQVLAAGRPYTPDLGGAATTAEIAEAIIAAL